MSRVTLPAGTVVKHGTTHPNLSLILSQGLVPGQSRSPLREVTEEAPVIRNGIYVGRLPAYFGALLGFTSAMLESLNGPTGPAVIAGGVVPVVLHIKLPEDVEVLADEDFVFPETSSEQSTEPLSEELLREKALEVWSQFGSAVLVREGGIPANWITHFEYPFLSSAANPPLAYDQDLGCLLAAHYQNSMAQTELETVARFRRKPHKSGDRFAFSQRCPFSQAGLAQLHAEPVFRNPDDLAKFSLSLWIAITKFGTEFGLATRF